MKKTKFLKICIGDWSNANRDMRELSVVKELGADITVMAKGEEDVRGDLVNGFIVDRYTTRPLGASAPAVLNRAFSFLQWVGHARKYDADIISGHDFVALLIGDLSNVGKSKKAKLVYDSHEFELGRNTNRSPLKTQIVKLIEGYLIKRSEFTVVVGDSIAKELQRIYKMVEAPLVVRNTPNHLEIDKTKSEIYHKKMLEDLNANSPEELEHVILYHGAVSQNRGVERLIGIIPQIPKCGLYVLGHMVTPEYEKQLKDLADSGESKGRVYFHPAVPLDEVMNYVQGSDCGMITIPAVTKSYYYMMPNKLFENIQAETPVVSSNFPEISSIVDGYGIGITVDPENDEEIIEAVKRILFEQESIPNLKENLKKAKEDLCWEKEQLKLKEAYSGILDMTLR